MLAPDDQDVPIVSKGLTQDAPPGLEEGLTRDEAREALAAYDADPATKAWREQQAAHREGDAEWRADHLDRVLSSFAAQAELALEDPEALTEDSFLELVQEGQAVLGVLGPERLEEFLDLVREQRREGLREEGWTEDDLDEMEEEEGEDDFYSVLLGEIVGRTHAEGQLEEQEKKVERLKAQLAKMDKQVDDDVSAYFKGRASRTPRRSTV